MSRAKRKNKPSRKAEKAAFWLAVLGLGGLLYALFFYVPEDPKMKGEQIGKIQTEGMVRRRHSRSLVWSDIESETPLYMRDFIYTPPGVRARVILSDNKTLELMPNTMVQFDSYSLDSIEVNLFAGKLRGKPKIKEKAKFFVRWQETKLLEYLDSLESMLVRHDEFVDRLRKRLNSPPARTKVRDPKFDPYTLNSLSHFELKLIQPARNRTLRLKKRQWVDALWTPIPLSGVRYEVQVSQRKKFDYFVSYQTNFNGISFQIQDPGRYYWRVIAKLEKAREEIISKPSKFSIDLRSSGVDSILGRLPTSVSAKYVAEVSRSENSGKVLVRQNRNTKKCAKVGLKRGNYYCRVRDLKSKEVVKQYSFSVGK